MPRLLSLAAFFFSLCIFPFFVASQETADLLEVSVQVVDSGQTRSAEFLVSASQAPVEQARLSVLTPSGQLLELFSGSEGKAELPLQEFGPYSLQAEKQVGQDTLAGEAKFFFKAVPQLSIERLSQTVYKICSDVPLEQFEFSDAGKTILVQPDENHCALFASFSSDFLVQVPSSPQTEAVSLSLSSLPETPLFVEPAPAPLPSLSVEVLSLPDAESDEVVFQVLAGGKPVPGAVVFLNGSRAETDSQGLARFSGQESLDANSWVVVAEKAGYSGERAVMQNPSFAAGTPSQPVADGLAPDIPSENLPEKDSTPFLAWLGLGGIVLLVLAGIKWRLGA